MTLGEIIKIYRTTHSYSMDDFSKLSGISKAYISLLEKNFNPASNSPIIPSTTIIRKAASGMGLTFDELFQQLNDDAVVSFDSLTNNAEEEKILKLYRALPPVAQSRALAYLEGLSDCYRPEDT